ncbi:MAG: hypothetical protein CML20_13000 [Rheinheimera sp.]|nr:hypothetical protein [Rheinheimera sp.]
MVYKKLVIANTPEAEQFTSYPVLSNIGPLSPYYLHRILTIVDRALADHPRTLAIRFDLHLPCGYGDVGSDLMTKFVESLKAQIKADLHRRAAQGKRVHHCNMRYIWARERADSDSPHFHVVILLNHDSYHTLGVYVDDQARNMASRIRKAWASTLRRLPEEILGLVHFPANPTYSVNVNSPDFWAMKTDLFRRLSYFAKLDTKEYGIHSRSFGCSLK